MGFVDLAGALLEAATMDVEHDGKVGEDVSVREGALRDGYAQIEAGEFVKVDGDFVWEASAMGMDLGDLEAPVCGLKRAGTVA